MTTDGVVITCDRCGKTRVTRTAEPGPHRDPERVTMTEFVRRSGVHSTCDVVIYRCFLLKCHDCGHEVTYYTS